MSNPFQNSCCLGRETCFCCSWGNTWWSSRTTHKRISNFLISFRICSLNKRQKSCSLSRNVSMLPHHLQLHRPAVVNKAYFGSAAPKELFEQRFLPKKKKNKKRDRRMEGLEESSMTATMGVKGSWQPSVWLLSQLLCFCLLLPHSPRFPKF